MARHPQVQSLETLQCEERGEGAHRSTRVAQPVGSHVHDVGDVAHLAKRLFEDRAVVGRGGRAEFGPALRVRGPLEVGAVHHRAANVHPVAADELRGRIDHDVDSVLDGAKQQRRHDGVVAERRQLVLVRDVADGLEVRHVVLGVADALEVDAAGVLVHQLVDLLGLVRVEEAHLDAEVLERLGEERPGAAVEAGGRDEILARVADGEQCGVDGRLPRRKRQPGRPPVHLGQTLLEHVVGRVHEPAVDVPELRECEEIGGVIGVVEDVRGRRVDGNGARIGGRVGLLPGVDGLGPQSVCGCFVAHDLVPLVVDTRGRHSCASRGR